MAVMVQWTLKIMSKHTYIGFGELQKKIEAHGTSANVAGAIAASIGRKKYGKKAFQKHAAEGKSMRNVKPKG